MDQGVTKVHMTAKYYTTVLEAAQNKRFSKGIELSKTRIGFDLCDEILFRNMESRVFFCIFYAKSARMT